MGRNISLRWQDLVKIFLRFPYDFNKIRVSFPRDFSKISEGFQKV